MTAHSTAACKQKGRRLQAFVRDKILETFPELTARDVISIPSGVSGEDILLSESANSLIPYSFECKNQESLSIWNAMEKTEQANRREAGILVFHRNNSNTYACLRFDILLKLLRNQQR